MNIYIIIKSFNGNLSTSHIIYDKIEAIRVLEEIRCSAKQEFSSNNHWLLINRYNANTHEFFYHDNQSNTVSGKIVELPVAALMVSTPVGTLVAVNKVNEDCPGIEISLQNEDVNTSKRIASIEYSPTEIACVNDSQHPYQTAAELGIVPSEQILYDRGVRYVKPCLVTKAWPDETNNRNFYVKTFHISKKTVKELL